ncbi:ubiquinol-cytochrome c reductase complex assembly factor 4 isoform X2 [Euwallacea similis]|uniref:ubiquinol-cytochrome c reductase complex assembly factor 4 isoform X2 n=1 Tax=Euwallacea similis TaxID=1736056 RepID=UPI00344E1C8C
MYRIKPLLPICSSCLRRLTYPNSRLLSSHKEASEGYSDVPIKFSTSPASKYKASTSRMGVENTRLWYEPYVILSCLTVFLVYFCILREENDIDKELDKSLYSRIEGLEETQLRLSLKYNLDNGLDTADIVHRLQEIEEVKLRMSENLN